MAEVLNRFGVETYYIYLGKESSGHDSTQFHYGNRIEKWDLSREFQNILGHPRKVIERLSRIKEKYKIFHCLATGRRAYYLQQAGINYKYWSYGADLDYQCFIRVGLRNILFGRGFKINPYRILVEQIQARDSIRYSDSVMITPYQLKALKKIDTGKNLFFLPHCFKIIDYHILLQQKEENRNLICKEVKAEQFFFSSVRQAWTGDQKKMTDNKGNDVMLYSFEKYLKLTKDDRTKLVLVKKGSDIKSTKSLSKSLRITNNVVWVDEMRREELDRFYQGAAICFGQFGTPVVTYAALEPLANCSISISLLNENDSIVPFYMEAPPIFNSKNPKEIADFMVRIVFEKENYADLSYKSWLWTKNHCSEEKFVQSFLEQFEEAHRWET